MRGFVGAARGAWPLLLALAACMENGAGYVEVKAFPGFALPLYLDTVKVGALKSGTAVLRQEVGRTKLQLERNGQLVPLCEFEVRKDRIVTVTVSASTFDRTLRCEVKK